MAKSKVALIFGITGQDGSYLAKLLLNKNYVVHGVKRKTSYIFTSRYDDIYTDPYLNKTNFILHYGDLTDNASIQKLITKLMPDEIYNLGAQSHVGVSFEIPLYTSDVVALGTLRILETIHSISSKKVIKFYQASSSEIFGESIPPQNELTAFKPVSPYAISKLYSYWMTKCYRTSYGMFACNGILFNHESPNRGENFVTKKIISGVVKIKQKKQTKLILGNLDSKRDWGDAEEYVEAMWKIMQQKKPDDFVIATGKSYSVREFLIKAFKKVDINLRFEGKGIHEKAYQKGTKRLLVEIHKDYFRPMEVQNLRGSYNKAKKMLKWEPKVTIDMLIDKMIKSELK